MESITAASLLILFNLHLSLEADTSSTATKHSFLHRGYEQINLYTEPISTFIKVRDIPRFDSSLRHAISKHKKTRKTPKVTVPTRSGKHKASTRISKPEATIKTSKAKAKTRASKATTTTTTTRAPKPPQPPKSPKWPKRKETKGKGMRFNDFADTVQIQKSDYYNSERLTIVTEPSFRFDDCFRERKEGIISEREFKFCISELKRRGAIEETKEGILKYPNTKQSDEDYSMEIVERINGKNVPRKIHKFSDDNPKRASTSTPSTRPTPIDVAYKANSFDAFGTTTAKNMLTYSEALNDVNTIHNDDDLTWNDGSYTDYFRSKAKYVRDMFYGLFK